MVLFCWSCFGLFQLVSAYSLSHNTIESAEICRLSYLPNQPYAEWMEESGPVATVTVSRGFSPDQPAQLCSPEFRLQHHTTWQLGNGTDSLLTICQLLPEPCLVTFQIPNFYTLFITSIFRHMHGALNIGKKITNYTICL
jgi:hypothetical protein